MDIDLLAKMVKEAILDNDAVTLPGVGCFVAELVPSSFSDKGYTIHPPYRRLYFSPKQGSDTLLADMYASARNVDREDATRVLAEFLAGMKEVLKVRKTIVFPGLGRLRATRENHFFFVADEDLDIYPEGFGLAPVSLKTHEETPEEVATAVAGLAEMMTTEPVTDIEEVEVEPEPEVKPEVEVEPEPEPVAQPEPEPQPEPAPAEEEEPELPVSEAFKETQRLEYEDRRRRQKFLKALRIALIVLGALLALLLLYILIGRVAPNWLDPLLYSKEELDILRY